MKGDFTRVTFDPIKHFSRALMQQGRVTLDADSNEQSAILLHYLRNLAKDIIGPYGAPTTDAGFVLTPIEKNIDISKGHYYVHGLLAENDADCSYGSQPYYPVPEDDPLLLALTEAKGKKNFGIYLDVWERHVTFIEYPSIRDRALGLEGPDTCTRAQLVWQVKALDLSSVGLEAEVLAGIKKDHRRLTSEHTRLLKSVNAAKATAATKKENAATLQQLEEEIKALEARLAATDIDSCGKLLAYLNGQYHSQLTARVDPGTKSEDPCLIAPDAKYRGVENQLYRVEIHKGGAGGTATFKWSRDNGSVVAAWLGTAGNDLLVASARGFEAGGWVELSDEARDLRGEPGVLVKIAKVEGDTLSVDPEFASTLAADALAWSTALVNPKIRRWDQMQTENIALVDGAIRVEESSATTDRWLDLEDGVQIRFSEGGKYRTGDYWLIPARVATGDIEWPKTNDGSDTYLPQTPFGIQHHIAPLALIDVNDGEMVINSNCRFEFEPLGKPVKAL